MVSSSKCKRVIRKVHVLGGHKGQERTWKDIAPAYHGIPQELVKVYVKKWMPVTVSQCIDDECKTLIILYGGVQLSCA